MQISLGLSTFNVPSGLLLLDLFYLPLFKLENFMNWWGWTLLAFLRSPHMEIHTSTTLLITFPDTCIHILPQVQVEMMLFHLLITTYSLIPSLAQCTWTPVRTLQVKSYVHTSKKRILYLYLPLLHLISRLVWLRSQTIFCNKHLRRWGNLKKNGRMPCSVQLIKLTFEWLSI